MSSGHPSTRKGFPGRWLAGSLLLAGWALTATTSASPSQQDTAQQETSRQGTFQQDTSRQGTFQQDTGPADQLIDRYVEDGLLPFLYLRVEDRDGRLLYERAARNTELIERKIDGDDWVRFWSMSKPVTIALAMDLVEDGVIALDEPVTRYLPELAALQVAVAPDGGKLTDHLGRGEAGLCPPRLEPVQQAATVEDLINHRDGFYYTWNGIPCLDEGFKAANFATAIDGEELIRRLARLPLINQPGGDEYYGFGTTVLGVLMERATGQTLDQLVRSRITKPLQLDGLQYGLPEGEQLPPHIYGGDKRLRPARPEELTVFGPQLPDYDPSRTLYLGGEGMVGTAEGFADFARMLLKRGTLNGHRLLEPATVEGMVAPHTMTDNEYGHGGYGLWVSNGRRPEGGVGPGPLWVGGGYEKTYFWIDPERGVVGVIITQIHNPPAATEGHREKLQDAVYRQLGWLASAPSR